MLKRFMSLKSFNTSILVHFAAMLFGVTWLEIGWGGVDLYCFTVDEFAFDTKNMLGVESLVGEMIVRNVFDKSQIRFK